MQQVGVNQSDADSGVWTSQTRDPGAAESMGCRVELLWVWILVLPVWPWASYLIFFICETDYLPYGVVLQIKQHNAGKALRAICVQKIAALWPCLPTKYILRSPNSLSDPKGKTCFQNLGKGYARSQGYLGDSIPGTENTFPILLRETIQGTSPNTDFNEWLVPDVTGRLSPYFPSEPIPSLWHRTQAGLVLSRLETKWEDPPP